MNRQGETVLFKNGPGIEHTYSIVGQKEGQGPLGQYFHELYPSAKAGEKTWEMEEAEMNELALQGVLHSGGLDKEDIDLLIGGDLINQIAPTNFAARTLQRPYLGVFGACSTLGVAFMVACMFLDGFYGNRAMVSTSSHYHTAERQYRTPLEYGDQYPAYKQWTVTGSGAFLLTREARVVIRSITMGTVVDYDLKDTNNLGGAMAPSAAQVIKTHLHDLNRGMNYYDQIYTGDLGSFGLEMLKDLLEQDGYTNHGHVKDCGAQLYDPEQKAGSGGSGCAASAVVLAASLFQEIAQGTVQKLLLVPTGALINQTLSMQGESIPAIAHAVHLERMEG